MRLLLKRHDLGWGFTTQAQNAFASEIGIPEELAWQIVTKGMDTMSGRREVKIQGDLSLGQQALRLTAIVALPHCERLRPALLPSVPHPFFSFFRFAPESRAIRTLKAK